MALIKCPECGGEVSSNADTCVHCGCRYSYCPECNAVHVGLVQKCSSCGYGLNMSAGADTAGGNVGFTGALKRRSATDVIIARILKIAYMLLFALALVMVVIAIVVVIAWDETSLEGLMSFKSVLSQVHGLSIAACILFVLAVASTDLRELYFQVLYARWLGKYNIDVVKFLQKDDAKLKNSFLPEEANCNDKSAAAYLTVVPHDASIKIFKATARTLLLIGCSVALGYFLLQNCEAVINAKLSGQSFVFSYVPLIFAVVFVAADILVTYVCEAIFSRRKDEWLKSVNLL